MRFPGVGANPPVHSARLAVTVAKWLGLSAKDLHAFGLAGAEKLRLGLGVSHGFQPISVPRTGHYGKIARGFTDSR